MYDCTFFYNSKNEHKFKFQFKMLYYDNEDDYESKGKTNYTGG